MTLLLQSGLIVHPGNAQAHTLVSLQRKGILQLQRRTCLWVPWTFSLGSLERRVLSVYQRFREGSRSVAEHSVCAQKVLASVLGVAIPRFSSSRYWGKPFPGLLLLLASQRQACHCSRGPSVEHTLFASRRSQLKAGHMLIWLTAPPKR